MPSIVVTARPANRRVRGFTLIEILIALMIASIILVTVYGALSRTLFSKGLAESRAELFAAGREATLRMADEIQAALPPQYGDRVVFRGVKGPGTPPTDSLQFIVMNRGGYGVSRVRPGLVLVEYSLEPLPNRRQQFRLRRDEELFAALLAEADGSPMPTDPTDPNYPGPVSVPMPLLDCDESPAEINIPGNCTRVVGLQFRYIDDGGTWRDSWDSTAENDATGGVLPAAVQLTLWIADDQGGIHDFTTAVDLPLAQGQRTPTVAAGAQRPTPGAQ